MTSLRIRTLLTSVALVASAGGVVLATDATASAGSSNEITTVSPYKPIISETFTVRGKLATAIVRPVQLQRLTSSGWKKVTSGSTTADGTFAIKSATTAKKTYRVFAQRFTIGDKTYGSRTTGRRTVTPVSQKVTTTVNRTTLRVGDTLVLTIANSPIRKGRGVAIRGTYQTGGGETNTFTQTVDVQNVNGKGQVDAQVSPSTAKGTYVYQGIAVEANGAPRKFGNKVTITIK